MKKALMVVGELGILVFLALLVMMATADAFQATQQPGLQAAPAAEQAPQLPLPGLPPIRLGGPWWAGLGMGLVAGVQATFVGMMKKRNALGEMPKLDLKLCLKTLAVGVVVGFAAFFLKWTPTDTAAWFVTAPIGGVVTAGVEDLVDLIWSKLSPPAGPGLGGSPGDSQKGSGA